ncbi:MAG: hypothetical protein KDJ35_01755 [Alphaproteobacteria bacterium]|nr:hypothetical protein [Alphaproteobacteria bacterium]
MTDKSEHMNTVLKAGNLSEFINGLSGPISLCGPVSDDTKDHQLIHVHVEKSDGVNHLNISNF